ncbi:uncharacterized protein [Anabrus simplex]|uniref:uncharacterized protein isoform X8 n=1 Tax=Anabrus simplex TaxID=316456 RepID=UPI0034DDAE2C
MWRTYGTVGDDIEDIKKNHRAERNTNTEDQRLRGSNLLRKPTKTYRLKRIRSGNVSKKTSNDRASTAKKVKRSNRSKNREMLVPEIKCEIEEGSIEFDESRETSGAEYSSGSCLASEVKSEPLSDGEGRNSNSDVTITPTTAPDRTSFAGVFVKEEPQSAESEMDIPVTEELNMIEVKGEPVEGTVKLEVVETMVAADSC